MPKSMRLSVRAFDRLKAELAQAFAAPDTAYLPLDADAVIARNSTLHERMHRIERLREDFGPD